MQKIAAKRRLESTLDAYLKKIQEQEACIAVLRAELHDISRRYETITTSMPWRLARLGRRILAGMLPARGLEAILNALFPGRHLRAAPSPRPAQNTDTLVAFGLLDAPSSWDAIILASGGLKNGAAPDPAAALVATGHRVLRVPGDLELALPRELGCDAGQLCGNSATLRRFLDSFEALRGERGVIEAVVFMEDFAWEPFARALSERHAWPVIDPSTAATGGDTTMEVAAWPLTSIIVVTYNNLAYTRLCLESLLRHRGYPRFEIIIVDNASCDGTPDYLKSMAAAHPEISVILNPENLGFAAANNQGLARARGERLVLLNNDTIVPRAWLSRLLRHLEDPQVGLAGPVTNSIGNEARIPVSYSDLFGIPAFVAAYYTAHPRPKRFDLQVLAMYCVAMRRDVFEKVGPLDEIFGVGMFEDDDYAHRVRLAGYRVVCCEDVFVHHFGETSFNKLKKDGRYRALFEENRAKFEKKWGMAWVPHTYRK